MQRVTSTLVSSFQFEKTIVNHLFNAHATDFNKCGNEHVFKIDF